jgi:hypothetical protein
MILAGKRMDESFESYQPYRFAVAYRMLGSALDAEDMVQESWVRYRATPSKDQSLAQSVAGDGSHAPVHAPAPARAPQARTVHRLLAASADPHVRSSGDGHGGKS